MTHHPNCDGIEHHQGHCYQEHQSYGDWPKEEGNTQHLLDGLEDPVYGMRLWAQGDDEWRSTGETGVRPASRQVADGTMSAREGMVKGGTWLIIGAHELGIRDIQLATVERLRDAALVIDDLIGRPDESMLEFLSSEHRDAMVEYWDAVDQLKPPGPDGRPPTQYLRPKAVGMDAKAIKPETT